MAKATRDDAADPGTIEFITEDDGTITAVDSETGLARGGDSRAHALAQLAEVLALKDGDGEPISDEKAVLSDLGIDPDAVAESREEHNELPEFMR